MTVADQSPLESSNWEQWTYVMAVQALTGDTGLSLSFDVTNKPFLEWDPNAKNVTKWDDSLLTYFCYFAFDRLYFRVTTNWDNLQAWRNQVADVVTVVNDLMNDTKRGTFDLTSLSELLAQLKKLQLHLRLEAADFQAWAKSTSGEDGPLAGKAIDVIRARLDQYYRTLQMWSDQLIDDSGAKIIEATSAAEIAARGLVNSLGALLFKPVGEWPTYAEFLADVPWILIYGYHKQWGRWAQGWGIAKSGFYKLDDLSETERVAHINDVLSRVVLYDPNKTYNFLSEQTWKQINQEIADAIKRAVKPLDFIAAQVVEVVFNQYTILSRSFPNLAEPAALNANTTEWSNLNTNLNLNMPNLDLNLPNLDLNFDINFPGFNFNLDMPNLNTDLPNLDTDLPNLNTNIGAPDLIGGPNFDGLGSGPNGLGDTFFKSTGPNEFSGLTPDIDGSAGLPGVIPGLGPVSGLGSNREILGPDGKPILGPNGEILGPDGKPILGPNGEILGPDGKPILGPNGEPILGGPIPIPDIDSIPIPDIKPVPIPDIDPVAVPGMGGGLPGVGGDGLSVVQVQPDGTVLGDLKRPEIPFETARMAAMSGMPFYPPMMGGMGGARGRDQEERERQTWLTEDEAVWGTKVRAVGSVIGRPEDDDEPDEELVILGPVRGARPVPRSSAGPQTRQDRATQPGASTPDETGVEREVRRTQGGA